MKQLSVTIITLNEERNIGRCLESLQEIADEIIVVDSFSTDKTKEISEKWGATFVQTQWKGYSETKNYANSLAKHDYVFSIDADEAVSDRLKASILKLKEVGFEGAYTMNRKTNYCGQWINHSGWYPDTKLRIWNKNQAQWKGAVHEQLMFVEHVKTELLKGDLFHYSYYTIGEHLSQINKYTDLAAKQMYDKGVQSGILKILFKPMVKFIRNYILKGGYRDGYFGFVICRLSAYATFLRYIKLKQLSR